MSTNPSGKSWHNAWRVYGASDRRCPLSFSCYFQVTGIDSAPLALPLENSRTDRKCFWEGAFGERCLTKFSTTHRLFIALLDPVLYIIPPEAIFSIYRSLARSFSVSG